MRPLRADPDSLAATITGLDGVAGVAISSDGSLYAVAPEGGKYGIGTTYVVDVAGRTVTAQFPRGGEWIAADSGSAYFTNPYVDLPDSVSVIAPSSATTMSPVLLARSYSDLKFVLGQAGHGQFLAVAVPPASFSATWLPAGLTLSPAGVISGTPASTDTGGFYQVTVTAANGVSPPDTEVFDVYVDQPPVITSAARATFLIRARTSFDVIAKGSPAPSFSETGALPKGIRFITFMSGAEITGAPASGTCGRHPITLTASNGAGTPAVQRFALIVDEPLSFTSPRFATFRAGQHGTYTVETHGCPAARLTVSGKLPHWLTFRRGRDGRATFGGRPPRRARHRKFAFTVTARNGVQPAVRQRLVITVR